MFFYEGPPSANGMRHPPCYGRTSKDLFCRYKTLKGFQVKRKAGWDTHGLPVEIGVERNSASQKKTLAKASLLLIITTNAAKVMKYKERPMGRFNSQNWLLG